MSLMPLGLLSQGGGATGGGNGITLISSTFLTSATASVTFSSIVGTYKHLQVRFTARTTSSGGDNVRMQMNSDTGNNYAVHYLLGDGGISSGNAVPWSTSVYAPVPNSSSVYGNYTSGIIDILDYSNTSKNTTVRTFAGKGGSGDNLVILQSGVWLNTSAVSSLRIYMGTGSNIDAYSRVSLYGVN
jgi:hypothetical protein